MKNPIIFGSLMIDKGVTNEEADQFCDEWLKLGSNHLRIRIKRIQRESVSIWMVYQLSSSYLVGSEVEEIQSQLASLLHKYWSCTLLKNSRISLHIPDETGHGFIQIA